MLKMVVQTNIIYEDQVTAYGLLNEREGMLQVRSSMAGDKGPENN